MPIVRLVALALVTILAVGCSRTGLFLGDQPLEDGSVPVAQADGAVYELTAPREACLPEEETCNGIDDDCDGDVDEVPAVPCPGGGERYCIGGRMSECPRRCEACLPGTLHVCFTSYCTYWGERTCAADGNEFGPCVEVQVPRECRDIALRHQNSPELEQCCIDNGYCCMDDFDLDDDGNSNELLGRCDEVLCQ